MSSIIKSILIIVATILVIVGVVKLFIWLLPVLLIGIVAGFVVFKLKKKSNPYVKENNSYINKKANNVNNYETDDVIDVDYKDV